MRQDGVSVKGFPLVEVRELTVNDEVRAAPVSQLARVRRALCGSVRGELPPSNRPLPLSARPLAPARGPPPATAALRLTPGPARPRRSIVDGRWHLSGTGWADGWG